MPIPGTLTTLKEARDYAERIKGITGKTHLIFKVPTGTTAYEMGWRYATCDAAEKEAYANDGAVFIPND